ncbi:MAG: phosphoesterase [Promethearchaeota archaeon]
MLSLTRILFASDIHGSKLVWVKFLNMIEEYKANVAIMGGDLSAKEILPIIHNVNSNSYYATLFGRKYDVKSKQELNELQERAKAFGILPLITDNNELQRISDDKKYQRKIFEDLDAASILEWIDIAKNRSLDKNLKLIMITGNDDSRKIDEILRTDDLILYPDRGLDLDAYHKLISFEYVNPTPWNSPRELSEKKLKKKLEKVFNSVDDYDHVVAAIHAPPFKSGLDNAPTLDLEKRPIHVLGAPLYSSVGSKAVREVIEKYQPKLTLHGHIHESGGFTYIGRTLSINPGSDYDGGILRAYLIDLRKEKIEGFKFVEDTGIKRLLF